MSNKVRKAIFIDRGKNIIGLDEGQMTREECSQFFVDRYSAEKGEWHNSNPQILEGRGVTIEGEVLQRFRREFDPKSRDGEYVSFFELTLKFGEWMQEHLGNVARNLRHNLQGKSYDKELVVVRSGSVVDAMAAGLYGINNSRGMPVIILDVNDFFLESLQPDYRLASMETYISHGENPVYPDNVRVSRQLLDYFAQGDNGIVDSSLLSNIRTSFLLVISGRKPVGMIDMFAEILPFYGGAVFASEEHRRAFDEMFFHRECDIPLPVGVYGEKGAVAESDNYVEAVNRVTDAAKQREPFYARDSLIKVAVRHLRFVRLDPVQVKNYLLNASYSESVSDLQKKIVAELVRRDLTSSFKTVEEIRRAVVEIKTDVGRSIRRF